MRSPKWKTLNNLLNPEKLYVFEKKRVAQVPR